MKSPSVATPCLALARLLAVGWLSFAGPLYAGEGDSAATNLVSACALSGPVGSVVVQPDGSFVIAGGGNISFVTPDAGTIGTLDGTVARFLPDGSLDYRFGCRAMPPSYSSVFDAHLATRPDGKFLLTGVFRSVNDQPRAGLARLRSDGRLDEHFVPWRGMTNAMLARSFHPPHFHPATFTANGEVVVPAIKPNPTTAELRVWRMNDTGELLGTVRTNMRAASFPASLLATLTERGLWLMRPVDWANGKPTGWSQQPRKPDNLMSFFLSGPPLSAGDAAEVLREVFAEVPLELCRNAVRLPDGGAILLVQEGDAGRFMRFNTNWQADLSYTNRLRARGYLSLAVQPDGKLLVARGSDLSKLGGESVVSVARVHPDGSLDESFHCEADERVMSLALQPDGKILIGGFFRNVNGSDASWLARLNPDGSLDQTFQRRFTHFGGLMAGRRVPVRPLAAAAKPTTAPATGVGSNISEPAATSIVILSLSVADGTAAMQFRGEPNRRYVLQARNALDAGEWFNVMTNRTDGSGSGLLRDAGAKSSPIRFYRVATP